MGFVGKLYAFRAVISANMYSLAVFGALNAAMAVYYYLRIIVRMYMEPRAEPLTFGVPQMVYPALVVAAVGVVLIGIFPDGALSLAGGSAELVGASPLAAPR